MSTSTAKPKDSEFLLQNYGRFDLTIARGEGSRVWDDTGREYLDFGAGIAVCSLGHSHPAIVKAISYQASQILHCSNLYRSPSQESYARALSEQVVGHPGKSVFVNSGAEANETLIKLARRFGTVTPRKDGEPRHGIVTFEGSFHGRTFAAISATGQAKIQEGFGPLVPGFTHVPFNDVDALNAAIDDNTCAILLEPIQGEGGIHTASPELLASCAALAAKHNLLVLLDEVQCGFGRIGNLAGWRAILDAADQDPESFVPHAVSWAKGMGGGYPIGAAWISNQEVQTTSGGVPLSSLLGPGSHGTTYGGGPVAMAVASAVLETIQDEGLIDHATGMGRRAIGLIEAIGSPAVQTVRGMGLMLGIALEPDAFKPHLGRGQVPSIYLVQKLMDAGLLSVPAGPNVVRWLPAMNVSQSELDEAVSILDSTLAEIFGE